MESKFIAAILSDRGAYEEVKDTLETADFSDLGTLIINQAIDFYKADPAARHVDNDVLLSRISRVHPAQEKLVANFLANMEPVSIPNMLQEYVDIRLASLARHLSQRMATGKVDPETRELIAQYQFLEERREAGLRDEEDNEVSIGLSVDSVLEALAPEQLVPIFPRQLNDAIGGGAPPGTHIVVFARPETGKTMFCVNMLCGFLTNGRKALYIGNEDPASNIKMRIINNITGMPKAEVESDRVRADRIVEEVVEDRLIYADLHPGSPGDVRSLVAKHRPDVVLVDQIRNLRTPRSFTKVEGLEYIAKEMRNIGKEFGCVMVSVTQAGDSADGKIELGMGDIDFSNTGIPATADVLIGIGCTPQMEMFGKRKLSLPKNKLSGNHNSIDVDVNPALSEVK